MKKRLPRHFTIIIGFSIAMLASLLSTTISIVQSRTTILVDLKETLNHESKTIEAALEGEIAKIDHALMGLANDYVLYKLNKLKALEEKFEFHKRVLKKSSLDLEFTLVDAMGTVVKRSNNVGIGTSLKDRAWFQEVTSTAANQLVISEPVEGRMTPGWILLFARKILDSDGKLIGALSAPVKVDHFENFRILLGHRNFNLFALGAGLQPKIITRYPINKESVGKSMPADWYTKAIDAGGRATYDTVLPSDQTEQIHTSAKIGDKNLFLTIGRDKKLILADWKKSAATQLLTLLGVNTLCFFMLLRYLKKEKLLEEQRIGFIQSSRLAAIGQMAGGIAHEINNPIAIISGKATSIKKNLSAANPDLQLAFNDLNKILLTVSRIVSVIRGMRIVARDGEKDDFEVSSINSIIEDTIALCIEKARMRGIELSFKQTQDIELNCRQVQIGQVVLNLISNSIDAIEDLPEKWIKIETEVTNKNSFEIAVTDSGAGINEKIVEQIMDPFFTTKAPGKGTGLGLSLSRSIIEDHGGKLVIDHKHKNTRFIITLPIQEQRPSPAALRSDLE